MLDMPVTPTNEQRLGLHAALPSPAAPFSSPSTATAPSTPSSSSSASSALSPAVPSPPLRSVLRSWLTGNVVPLFGNKYTRLIISLILVTFNVIVLYFAAFAFYLTHFLSLSDPSTDEPSSAASCSSFPLSLFLVFLFFRCLCSLLLITVRIRDSSMWVNQRSQMSRPNKCFHLISLALFLLSAAFLSLGYTWLASGESDQCVQLAKPLVAAIVVYETLAVLWPLAVIGALSAVFPLKALSPFTPYMPLTSDTFVQDKSGLSRREIDSLPSFLYTAGLYDDDDRRCSICLGDVEAGERLRQLRCSHRFHQPCVDEWLLKKPTCPLCVQKVEAQHSKRRQFRFSLSRTTRRSSPSSSQRPGEGEGTELSASDRSRAAQSTRVDQHEGGLEAHGLPDGLEMV